MTIDPEMLMAYADGELDPLAAKRVERAVAADPGLAHIVEQHRALRSRMGSAFASTLGEPLPPRLKALLQSNVVAIAPSRTRPIVSRWRETAALAACVALGLALGLNVQRGPVAARSNGLYASGELAKSLDTQSSSESGAVRIAVSFRDMGGNYCRVFTSSATDGIACHDNSGWALRQTRSGSVRAPSQYTQAGSVDADLMAAAQGMMAGYPLDSAAETGARKRGWR